MSVTVLSGSSTAIQKALSAIIEPTVIRSAVLVAENCIGFGLGVLTNLPVYRFRASFAPREESVSVFFNRPRVQFRAEALPSGG